MDKGKRGGCPSPTRGPKFNSCNTGRWCR